MVTALAALFFFAPVSSGVGCETREPDTLETLLTNLSPAIDCSSPIDPSTIPAADWTFFAHIAADNDQELGRTEWWPGK